LAQDKKLDNLDRESARMMLAQIRDDLKKHYYDPNFHGLNLDARIADAQQKIAAATTVNQSLSIVAAVLVDLNDSHAFFIPPPRPCVHDYGLKIQFFGDKGAFVTSVRPGSDAEAKGVKAGDQLTFLNDYEVSRDNFWKMEYVYWALRPQPSLHLSLRTPQGREEELGVNAFMRPTKKVMDFTQAGVDLWQTLRDSQFDEDSSRPRYWSDGKGLTILKLPNFELEPEQVNGVLDRLRSQSTVIIDLRGNPGGYTLALERFVGGFFDHPIKIADQVLRKERKPSMSEFHGRTFAGRMFVLVDSKSASCAEMFARVMQLEGRATVIGDRSSGKVMEARIYPHHTGVETVLPYAASITEADMIMTDGKSIENVGVIPEVPMLPSPRDIAEGRDPVLAFAVQLAGGQLSPEDAGKMFPVRWAKH
jgi:C-terminal processing protease CtpA/Prc